MSSRFNLSPAPRAVPRHSRPPILNPNPPAARTRLDLLLVARGLCESREKAQRAIMAGDVSLHGHALDKPGTRVPADAPIVVKAPDRYVGRGGHKLEAALREFAIDPTDTTALDIGASTGGFTDCLLQHGAAKVWAIDVGHSQLDWKIRRDPRVVVREKLNARYLSAADIPALIKPQFELRREDVKRGGVVRDPALHERAVEKIRLFTAGTLRRQWAGCLVSPILGGEGNTEFLACLRNASA